MKRTGFIVGMVLTLSGIGIPANAMGQSYDQPCKAGARYTVVKVVGKAGEVRLVRKRCVTTRYTFPVAYPGR